MSSCEEHIFSIPTVGKPEPTVAKAVIQPLMVRRQPGKPEKKKDLVKRGDHMAYKCGRCGQIGSHNK